MKDSVLNRFIGVVDERDEYQKQEIYKELAFSGIIFYYISMFLMFVSVIVDILQNDMSFMTVALMVLNIGYSGYVVFRLNRKQLDASDCATPKEYELKKGKLKRSSTFGGVFWGMMMFLLNGYLLPFLSGDDLTLWWMDLILWSLGGVAFGVLIYYFSKSKLQKQYTEE